MFNRDLQREQNFDLNELSEFVQSSLPKLNAQQRNIYDTLMQAVANNSGGFHFLDAPCGTGKTFLISIILATIRSQNKIALALASSGTAATLLDDGRTAHSALVLLAGDFRQILPVIPRSTAADDLNASLKSSILWKYLRKCTLTTNVRVQLQNDPSADEFSKQLLKIGDGKMPIDNETGLITLPTDSHQSKQELIERVFPDITQQHKNHRWLSERAILAAKNKDVSEMNMAILKEIPAQLFTFKSVDTVMNEDEVLNYPTEFLNSLDLPGLPPVTKSQSTKIV